MQSAIENLNLTAPYKMRGVAELMKWSKVVDEPEPLNCVWLKNVEGLSNQKEQRLRFSQGSLLAIAISKVSTPGP